SPSSGVMSFGLRAKWTALRPRRPRSFPSRQGPARSVSLITNGGRAPSFLGPRPHLTQAPSGVCRLAKRLILSDAAPFRVPNANASLRVLLLRAWRRRAAARLQTARLEQRPMTGMRLQTGFEIVYDCPAPGPVPMLLML